MTDTPVLNASLRDATGSRSARKSRIDGTVPAVLYGHRQDNILLAVDGHELGLALATPAQVFSLSFGGKEEPCLVKEVQYDPFGQHVLHVDLMRVDLSEEVEVEVRLDISGHAKGIIEGGVLEVQNPTVKVLCRADSIPEFITVDVSELALGDSIHAGELVMPAGVRIAVDAEAPIAAVAVPKRVEEEVVAEEEEAVEGEAPAEGETPAEGDAPADADGEPEKKE